MNRKPASTRLSFRPGANENEQRSGGQGKKAEGRNEDGFAEEEERLPGEGSVEPGFQARGEIAGAEAAERFLRFPADNGLDLRSTRGFLSCDSCMAFLVHGPGDGRPGAVEPGHDRPLLDPQGPGHVFIGKTGVCAENEDFAELPGQGFDRRFQADETILEIVRPAVVRGGGEVSPGIERVEGRRSGFSGNDRGRRSGPAGTART